MQGLLFQVDIPEIVMHEGDEPDAVFDLFDAEPLPGKHSGDVFLRRMRSRSQAATATSLSLEWIAEFDQALISAGSWSAYRIGNAMLF